MSIGLVSEIKFEGARAIISSVEQPDFPHVGLKGGIATLRADVKDAKIQ